MSSNKIKLKMMIGEFGDDNLIEIEDELFEVSDDNEVNFLEVMLEEGVMAKKKKVKVHGMELSISKKSLQESVNKSIDDTIDAIDTRFIQKLVENLEAISKVIDIKINLDLKKMKISQPSIPALQPRPE